MEKKIKLPEAKKLVNTQAVLDIVKNYIFQKASSKDALQILEAGCGNGWGMDLKEIQHILTGVDLDENALNIRRNLKRDLDVAILGDLRTVSLDEDCFDIIVSLNVLEHVDGAEDVLKNFTRWLNHGGLMLLVFPNRDSGYGFMTRIIPFVFHVFYKKYVQGIKNAGKPGHDPYPVYFDKVVSRNGIIEFCKNHGLVVKAEYRIDGRPIKSPLVWFLVKALLWALYLVSFTKLTFNYRNLFYVIEKP